MLKIEAKSSYREVLSLLLALIISHKKPRERLQFKLWVIVMKKYFPGIGSVTDVFSDQINIRNEPILKN